MLRKFADVLSVLLDYYGNFERDSRIALLIQQVESGGSYTGSNLADDDLEDTAAAGSPSSSSSFPKDPVNRESHGTQ
jgi:hypothetical protein